MDKWNELQYFEEIMNLPSKIVLYGAGNVCRKILQNCLEIGKLEQIEGIVVSQIENKKTLYGIKISEYHADLYPNDQLIVIASTAYADEIAERLNRDGKENVFCLADGFEKNMDACKDRIKRNYVKQLYDGIVRELKTQSPSSEYDIAFITPPYWDMYSPFSAVPCLKAFLKEKGYKALQIDLGIICIRYAIHQFGKLVVEELLSEGYYNTVIKKYRNNIYSSYASYCEAMDDLQEDFDVDRIKSEYCSYSFEKKCVVDDFYQRIYYRDATTIDFDTCESLDAVVEDVSLLTLYETFDHAMVKQFFRQMPEVIGISITSTCQFIPGCVLAKLIHDIRPGTKIIFGGSCADLFINSGYKNKSDIYKYFDYVIVGEGETALLKLLESLKGKAVRDIPNLIQEEAGELKVSSLIIEDVEILPMPDYDDLDLSLYLAPETILPYQSSRGCHYGQCAFCNHDEKYRHNYRSKDMKKVVDELVFLSQKYDVHCFQFVDEAIRPDCFRLMINEMERNEDFQGITWLFYSRVSRRYDTELVKRAYENGCRMVMFGVESFNQRLLNFIKKGISAETSKYCLQLFHRNHIKTYAWMMNNLPSETLEEAYGDLEEIKKQISDIDAFAVGPFMLVKNSDMYKSPEAYNIVEVNEKDACRFQSHNGGKIIDKEEMLRFHREEYLAFQLETFLTGNRYTLFFDDESSVREIK